MNLVFFNKQAATEGLVKVPLLTVAKSGTFSINGELAQLLKVKAGDGVDVGVDPDSQAYFLCHWVDGRVNVPKVSRKSSGGDAFLFTTTWTSNYILKKEKTGELKTTIAFTLDEKPIIDSSFESIGSPTVYALKRVTSGKWAVKAGSLIEKKEPDSEPDSEPDEPFTESSGLEAQPETQPEVQPETQPEVQPETPAVLPAIPRAFSEEDADWLLDFGKEPKNPVIEGLTTQPLSQQSQDEIKKKPLDQPTKPKPGRAQIMGVFGSSWHLMDKADVPKKKVGAAGKKKTAAKKKPGPKK